MCYAFRFIGFILPDFLFGKAKNFPLRVLSDTPFLIARLHGFYHIFYFIFFTPKNQALLTKNFSFRFSFGIIHKDGSKT